MRTGSLLSSPRACGGPVHRPAHAVQCVQGLPDSLAGAGGPIRAGLHTGEVERRHDDLGGLAVHIAARAAALANEGEVFVSRTVRDLVVGSGLDFEDCGAHELKGVPGNGQIYAASSSHRRSAGTGRVWGASVNRIGLHVQSPVAASNAKMAGQVRTVHRLITFEWHHVPRDFATSREFKRKRCVKVGEDENPGGQNDRRGRRPARLGSGNTPSHGGNCCARSVRFSGLRSSLGTGWPG